MASSPQNPIPKNTAPKRPAPRAFVINPEADRQLARISLLYTGISFVLLLALMFLVPYIIVHYPVPPLLRFLLQWGSLLVVFVFFLVGMDRMNAARLDIGRERVQARVWSEAVAALQPFDSLLLRFWDRTGEAHFLLAQAYAGLGDKVRAEKARAFVRRKPGSPWAEKLAPNQGPSISRSRAKVYDSSAEGGEKSGPEKRPTPPKSKPRRRF